MPCQQPITIRLFPILSIVRQVYSTQRKFGNGKDFKNKFSRSDTTAKKVISH
jgi:hypothetical protein